MVKYLFMKIKYIGNDKKLDLKLDKLYEAKRSPRESEKAWISVIDETGEAYAYPLNIFEIVEE